MKSSLGLSLVLNVCLLGAVGYLVTKKPETAAAPAADKPSAAAHVKKVKMATPKAEAPAGTTSSTNTTQKFDWHSVESEDYRQYIANLRSIGCPEETIRDIIIADVNKLFESRRKELVTGGKKFEFWKTGNMFSSVMDPEKLEKQQALAKEKRALLKELLGVEPEEKFEMFAGANPFESMLDFLPTEKQNKVMEMYREAQVKMAKKFQNGAPDAEDMKEYRSAQKEMEAELAKILTPQELQDFQLRMSQTAMMMRMQLGSFDPNEQEFRDIFKLRKAFDDEYGIFGAASGDSAERKKYNDAKKTLDEQVKTLLGDTRYAEYERSQDWTYQGIAKVVERQGLPKENAVKVFDMKKTAEEEASKVRANKNLTGDQRKEALKGIREETERSMKQVLGDKGFDAYKKQNTAYWLRNLSPDPKSTE